MAKVIIEGFSSLKEAKKWVSGYEGQAEQNMCIWSDENGNFPCITDMTSIRVEGDNIIFRVK